MDNKINEIVESYRKIALIPSVTDAKLVSGAEGQYVVESSWKQRDLEREENIKFKKWSTVNIKDSCIDVSASLHSSEVSGELLSSYTRCGTWRAVVREITNKEQKKIQFLEIWEKSRKIINVDLKATDKHGEVHSNGQFGTLEWSYDNKKILYVAEKKIDKSCSYFSQNKEEVKAGQQHVYRESWGEQLTQCHHPTICIFDLETKEIKEFSDVVPDRISAGHAVWSRDDETIVFVGWPHEPFRLGLIYCPMRPNALFLLNVRFGKCVQLTDEGYSRCTPRLSPLHNGIVYLENPVFGPHQNCSKLIKMSLPVWGDDPILPQKGEVLVDSVEYGKNGEFPGLFLQTLPKNCWTKSGSHVILSTNWRSTVRAVAIDASNGDITMLTKEGESIVHDVTDDIIVMSYSTPSSPPKLILGKFSSDIEWKTVEQPIKESLNLKWTIQAFQPKFTNQEFPEVDAEYILLTPNEGKNLKTLIVNPHGGPHICNVAGFVSSIGVFCELGFTVLQVNYRGSTGFGSKGIESLPGRVGTQDVADVQEAAERVKRDLGVEKVYITGGSHGGFLTLQLISQYPEFYRAACVRNPVTNLVSMLEVSDIPDWKWCEGGLGRYKYDGILTPSDYKALCEKSPVTLITKATAPVLVMVGDEDKRVPPSQGREWARKYMALGRECRVLEYKGNCHPLSKVDAEADGFVNQVRWFLEH